MGLNQFGVIGLGVMGSNLAQNLLENKVEISVYDKSNDAVNEFKNTYNADAFTSIEAFVKSLHQPRQIIVMVTAGAVVDQVIADVLPFLSSGDTIIDGGNSYYLETMNRTVALQEKKVNFIGMGISGGASGARHGASLMPSGNRDAVLSVMPILEKIAARTTDHSPCVDYIGESGSGHFIKMVHNGIEYADMQIICDAYAIMKLTMSMSNREISNVFSQWNQGRLKSYLTEITIDILRTKDNLTQHDLVDMISDKAGSKGTGKWTVQYAIEEALPCGTLFAALDVRNLSQVEKWREETPVTVNQTLELEELEEAVYASKVLAYMQGFSLMEHASKQYGWELDFTSISRIWGAGCIIQGQLIQDIYQEFKTNKNASLMKSTQFQDILMIGLSAWQNVVSKSAISSTHIPVISAALSDYMGYVTPTLSTNLLQAMRDYFGGHTYARMDREGSFHTDW